MSIVVPIYNRENFIDRCIKSILSQVYKNIEIILVDDGSTDGSSKICDEYAKIDNRIKVIHKINGGVQSARNVGIDNATGKYICFVDADDYVSKNYISNFVNVYRKESVECVVCGYYRMNNNGTFINKNDILINLPILNNDYKKWSIYFERFACFCWNHMFLLDIIKNNNIRFDDNIKIFDDTAFTMEYIRRINCVGFTRSNDYYYIFLHDELTVTKSLSEKRVSDDGCKKKAIACVEKYNKYILQNNLIDNIDKNRLSSSLYHVSIISIWLYFTSLLYDYRFDKKKKDDLFDDFYHYVMTNKIDKWHYNFNDLYTKLVSYYMLKPISVMLFKTNKCTFILFCKLFGNNSINYIRRKVRDIKKK